MKIGVSKKYFVSTLFIVLAGLIFLYGMAVGYRKYPPFELIQAGYMRFLKADHFEEVSTEFLQIDTSELISISSESDVLEKRMQLIKFIWGVEQESLPDYIPANIERSISDDRYFGMGNLASIDKITVEMEYGINSIAYHFKSDISNDRLVVYHQGHKGDFIAGRDTIESLLGSGYSVMAISMPLGGFNNNPTVSTNIFGDLKLRGHDDFRFVKPDSGSPIKFFVEPLSVILNYIEEFNYKDVSMVGISGGGWTTVLYSALDPRISKSYPVAGSLPIYLRDLSFEGGDYEQSLVGLYHVANYLDLYILGSYGEDRGQLQIFNKFDSCCFAGVRYKVYESEIKNVISSLGVGTFGVFLDDTHREHKISEVALSKIINDLGIN